MCPMASSTIDRLLSISRMFALLQNHATGMPVLDAEADFRRARRAHAVARVARLVQAPAGLPAPAHAG